MCALIVCAVATLAAAMPAQAQEPRGKPVGDYVDLVDPWVEADIARWFFFKSANTPFGLVKLRPDTPSGYRTTEHDVLGFSHIHEWQVSGVQVMPTSGPSVPKTGGPGGWQSHVEHDGGEVAEPGYHRVHLDRYAIDAELTATDRVGVHRYTYARAGQGEVVVNLGGTLGEGVMDDAHVTRVSATELEGWVDQRGGSYADHDTRLFFTIRFDRPFDSLHGWAGGRLVDGGAPVDEVAGTDAGVFVRYDELPAGARVQMKVGLSLTGAEGARRNLRAEAPGWDFDAIRSQARRDWNEMLGRIDVRGGTRQQQIKFYTDLFHVLSGRGVASDVDGKYMDDTWNNGRVKQLPLGRDGRPRFEMFNYDALWLTQWNVNTVLGLAYPDVLSSFVNSQLQMYRDGGLLPRGPVAGNDSLIMTGSPVTSFIAGAWNKGVRDFDVDLAYDAMLDAHSVGGLFDKGALEYRGWGAGGVRDYLDRGYVRYRSGSGLNGGAGMTLEYAFQDWTLAQLARQLRRRGINATQFATVEVSSQRNGSEHAGERAIDGRPIRSTVGAVNDVEWRSAGERTPWIRLGWERPRTVRSVALSDRADTASNVRAGVLTFSDGSRVAVGALPTDGAEREVRVAPRRVSWVRFEVTDSAGDDVGLNEIEVWDDTDVAAYLTERSRNWRNVFDTETGFVRPRHADGTWLADFDPLSGADFVEANSWQATWFVPHDAIGEANLLGGEAAYADKLNYAFERAASKNFIGSYGQGYVSYGNQPGLPVAHMFNYVGYPWLTQYWARQVKEKTYGSIATNDGYGHHDEDQGQMGAMSALMAIGLFEVSGGGHPRPVYDVTSPIFDQVTIRLDRRYGGGKTFRIVTHGNSADNAYIQRASLDGRRLDDAWFTHDRLADGGQLHLWLGARPNKRWGVDRLPPSASRSEGRRPVYATELAIDGPATIDVPYASVPYAPRFTPADTTWQRARWSVTAPDGSPTDKATIDQDGVLTVDRFDGQVLITASNADGGPSVRATKLVTLALDVDLLRGNAARWPGVAATASSEYSGGFAAGRVHDGDGAGGLGGDWASAGERKPWVQLDWRRAIRADRVVIYDRPGDDDVNAGVLTFSDGTSVAVDAVPKGGRPATVRFPMKTFEWVRFQVRGGTGLNPGLSELEVYAVPAPPDAPTGIAVSRDGSSARVGWAAPAFDGGAPITGYVVTAWRDGAPAVRVSADAAARSAVVSGLDAGADYAFTVAASNMLGVGEEGREPVLATALAIDGPSVVAMPYGRVEFSARFTPDDTTLKRAEWSVTAADGGPTDVASIDAAGVLTVNHRDGVVRVVAEAADGGGARASVLVRVALDPSLLRVNAARWPGVRATASSVYDAGYAAAKVHDGFGAGAGEWASAGQQNPWIELDLGRAVEADQIVLHDRPGVDDVNGGTLTFSDGSTVEVTGVPRNGAPATTDFPLRRFAWVRFQVRGGTGPNVGLRELEVRAKPSVPDAPTRVTVTPADGEAVVRWTPPDFDGGTPITAFHVTPYRDGIAGDPILVGAEETRAVVPGVSAGVTLEATVTARNVVGLGAASEKG